MKNKLVLVLISTLLTVSMIGCGSKEKQTTSSVDSKANVSVDQDVEIKKDYGDDVELVSKKYLKITDSKKGAMTTFIGKVVADKDNISKLEGLDKTEGGKTKICYLDTTGGTDLKLGDFVNIGIKEDKNNEDNPTEFKYTVEPISSTEYNKTVSERVGDTRDKSTKDNYVYLTDTKGTSYFVPELSIVQYQDMMHIKSTPVLDKQNLNSIRGEYDGEVVLIDIKNGESMVIAAKVNDKYEYYCISLADLERLGFNDKNYKIGDKVKAVIGIYPQSTEQGIAIE